MRIPARPTTYNGIRMRSRTEATFAAFLDRVGYVWEYEPRAFASAEGQYLPDFALPFDSGSPIYIETKGARPTPEELHDLMMRMSIIGSSEPDAFGVIFAAAGGRWGYGFDLTEPRRFYTIGFGICQNCSSGGLLFINPRDSDEWMWVCRAGCRSERRPVVLHPFYRNAA